MCTGSKPPKPKPRPVIQPEPAPVQPVAEAAADVKIGADTSAQGTRKKATRSSLRQKASAAPSEPTSGLGS